jgi:hypothetical protein
MTMTTVERSDGPGSRIRPPQAVRLRLQGLSTAKAHLSPTESLIVVRASNGQTIGIHFFFMQMYVMSAGGNRLLCFRRPQFASSVTSSAFIKTNLPYIS